MEDQQLPSGSSRLEEENGRNSNISNINRDRKNVQVIKSSLAIQIPNEAKDTKFSEDFGALVNHPSAKLKDEYNETDHSLSPIKMRGQFTPNKKKPLSPVNKLKELQQKQATIGSSIKKAAARAPGRNFNMKNATQPNKLILEGQFVDGSRHNMLRTKRTDGGGWDKSSNNSRDSGIESY